MTEQDNTQPSSQQAKAGSSVNLKSLSKQESPKKRPLRQARLKSMDYLSYDQALDYTIAQIKKQSAREYKKQQQKQPKSNTNQQKKKKTGELEQNKKQKTLNTSKLFFDYYSELNKHATKNPDNIHSSSTSFRAIAKTKDINFGKTKPKVIEENCSILGLTITYDGNILAAFTQLGFVKLFETENYELIQTLHDYEEAQIDEFYSGQFSRCQKYLLVGGKRKDRSRWCQKDDDNHILPCTIKVFDVVKQAVIDRLDAHTEEILDIQWAVYKDETYFVSCSQDGSIYKWKIANDPEWKVEQKRKFNDNISCMSFSINFLPNTGNRMVAVCCDDSLKLFDFETLNVIKVFEDLYSSYLDHAHLMPAHHKIYGSQNNENCAYIVTRGVELLDLEDNTVASRPNSCTLHKIEYPIKERKDFKLTEVKRLKHEEYVSNSWLIKISAYADCIYAPTNNGRIFVYNVISGHVESILHNHLDVEVRQALLNPKTNDMYTCADDGKLCIYCYKPDEEGEISITD